MNRSLVLIVMLSACLFSAEAQHWRGMHSNVIRDDETGTDIYPYNESWALIIGIDKYQEWPQLEYAVNDAKSVRQLLIDQFEFKADHVTILLDKEATLQYIKTALSDIAAKANQNDRLLVYFSGHGQTQSIKGGGEMGYLIPVEGSTRDDRLYVTCLPMSEIKNLSNIIPAKHILFIVDACYSGLAASTQRSLPDETKLYLKQLTSEKGRQIITAGTKGEKSIERAEWGHGAFTYGLLEGLGKGLADLNNDRLITATELGDFLRSKVARLSEHKQTPQFKPLTDEEGEFVFILPESAAEVCDLLVTSSIPGADIFLDGQPTNLKTPSQLTKIPKGVHTIELVMDSLGGRRSITLVADRLNNCDVVLSRLKGSLSISSTPPGADIYVDGKPHGRSPLAVLNIDAGTHTLVLKKEGFAERVKDIVLRPYEELPIEVSLAQSCMLRVESVPESADVFVNNKLSGKTPARISNLDSGDVTVSILKDDFETWSQTFHLEPGDIRDVRGNLVGKYGLMSMTSIPESANVYVDHQFVGVTPLASAKIEKGERHIRISKQDFNEWEEVVQLTVDAPRQINAPLISKYGFLTVVSSPTGASVSVDDKFLGMTPLNLARVHVGAKAVKISREDYAETTQTVKIEPGLETKISPELQTVVGFISVAVAPSYASVMVDNEVITASTVERFKVSAGAHTVTIFLGSNPHPASVDCNIAPGDERKFVGRFDAFSLGAVYRSAVLPGWGQIYDGATLKGWAYVAAWIGGIGYSAYAYSQYFPKNDAYLAARNAYLEAARNGTANRQLMDDMDAKSADAQDVFDKQLEPAELVSAAVYGISLIDALIFHSKGSEINMLAAEGPQSVMPFASCSGKGFSFGVRFSF